MEFLFVIFYKKVDKVGIEMLYLVNKILLLEQLVLGSKEIALIYYRPSNSNPPNPVFSVK